MSLGLSPNDVINVGVVLTPLAAAMRNFGILMIQGSSGVIDTTERFRIYSGDIETAVAADFGTTAPEYLAAVLFASQVPQPSILYIGAYAQTATSGRLVGGPLTVEEQAIANFQAITTGALSISVDGTEQTLTAIDFAADQNLNAVAATLTTAFAGAATVVWNSIYSRFQITSASTGSASLVAFPTVPGAGTDIAPILGLYQADGARLAPGSAIETAIQGAQALAAASNAWYGLMLAPVTAPSNSDVQAVAGYIEGAAPSRIFGNTTQAAAVIDPTQTTDIASLLQAANYNRTFTQYSSSSPYAVASFFGRALTVNFSGSNTTLTMKFQQEPGVTAETLTESQAQALNAKNCNVFVNYNNGTAIVQQGVMASGQFFDTIQGVDALSNAIQTAGFNLLYTAGTKIPQTDAGANQLTTTYDSICESYVTNGFLAPGQWNGPPIGALATGQTLAKGYYVYTPPVASQSQAARATRAAPPSQIAVKLAGAIHSASVVINVNQ